MGNNRIAEMIDNGSRTVGFEDSRSSDDYISSSLCCSVNSVRCKSTVDLNVEVRSELTDAFDLGHHVRHE